ncbi:DUF6973 domain-containing protein, partial [Pseudoglutamicibacter cumminsii]|uniref:DUF6973 domain-containing protein n=1 Tax=Pseudoglutamicibacter cumminsii TaxID=156979 RepID=UPI001C632BC8
QCHSIGENGAMKIASNHEAVRNGPAREKKMDLANNKTGRSVGKAQKQLQRAVLSASLWPTRTSWLPSKNH